jgi:hypothetical protein
MSLFVSRVRIGRHIIVPRHLLFPPRKYNRNTYVFASRFASR